MKIKDKDGKKNRYSYIPKSKYPERYEIKIPILKRTPGPGHYDYSP